MMEIRTSGLARVMQCTGSLFFKDLPPQPTNEAAKEGTAAGEYLERLLTGQELGTHASNGVPFNDDMKFHLTPIYEEIIGNKQSEVLCEQRIDWEGRSGVRVRGQYDVSFIREGALYIDDLKYGWGIVEVEENWQLLGYAVGEVIRRNTAFDKIVLRIHQPRPHHEDGPTREWVLSYSELLNYKEKIEQQLDIIGSGGNALVTGPSCKYCPAAAVCPAAGKAYFRGVEVVNEFIQDDIDNDELSFQLDLIQRIEEMVKTRKGSLEDLAAHRIKEGQIIPNYVADNRYGNRSWKSEFTPESIKLMTGVDVTEKTIMTPAKAEKMGLDKKFLKALTERRLLGQKVKRKDTSKLGDKIFGKPKG